MVNPIVHETGTFTPRRHLLWLTVAILCTHGWSLGGGFVWDDGYNVGQNESIRTLGNIPSFFQNPWASSAPLESHARRKNRGLYRPLTQTSYTLDYALFGRNAAGFHAINVLIHLISALLLLALARRFLSEQFSLWVTLLWAVHPVHTETVALLSYRTSLLAACFGLGATLIRTSKMNKTKALLLRYLLFTAGVFSKEDGLIFAAIIPLFDLSVLRIDIKAVIRSTAPIFVLSVLYLLLRAQIIEPGLETHFFRNTPLLDRTPSLLSILWTYLTLVVAPFPLTPFYDWDILGAPGWTAPSVWLGLITLGALLTASVRGIKQRKRAFLAICVLLALLPYSHILPFTVGAAERFLYVPSMFAGILIGWTISTYVRPHLGLGMKRACWLVFLIWFLALCTWTSVRHTQWWSFRAITEATVDAYPQSFNAWSSVATARSQDGDIQAAHDAYDSIQSQFPCSLSIWPTLEQIRLHPHQNASQLSSLNDYAAGCSPQLKRSEVAEFRTAFETLELFLNDAKGTPTPTKD